MISFEAAATRVLQLEVRIVDCGTDVHFTIENLIVQTLDGWNYVMKVKH